MTTVTNSAKAAVETPVSPNIKFREVFPIRNWGHWLEEWQSADSFEAMLGLLHVGFNVSLEGRHYNHGEKGFGISDRIIFYLGVADGWADINLFLQSEGDRVKYQVGFDEHHDCMKKSHAELRQMLAAKAFNMVCLNSFKFRFSEGGHERSRRDWEVDIMDERLFPAILDFFRAEEGNVGVFGKRVKIRNLSWGDDKSNIERQAVAFLKSFASFLWSWEERDISSQFINEQTKASVALEDSALRARIDSAKPWMIEVLNELNSLDLLERWALRLDEPCLDKLKEIALRKILREDTHPVRESRSVESLDESFFLGSPAAKLLKHREIYLRVYGRLKAIMDEEDKIRKAEDDLAKLKQK